MQETQHTQQTTNRTAHNQTSRKSLLSWTTVRVVPHSTLIVLNQRGTGGQFKVIYMDGKCEKGLEIKGSNTVL